MLVLSRYKDQSIYIGDDIVVTIVDVRGDRIRLGIEAPADVPVHRQEIYEAIQRENSCLGESPREGGRSMSATKLAPARSVATVNSAADYEVRFR